MKVEVDTTQITQLEQMAVRWQTTTKALVRKYGKNGEVTLSEGDIQAALTATVETEAWQKGGLKLTVKAEG